MKILNAINIALVFAAIERRNRFSNEFGLNKFGTLKRHLGI
jgi:ornithine carbamoyltransferase